LFFHRLAMVVDFVFFFFQLLTFLQIRQPGKFMRAMVFLTQGLCQTTANTQTAADHGRAR